MQVLIIIGLNLARPWALRQRISRLQQLRLMGRTHRAQELRVPRMLARPEDLEQIPQELLTAHQTHQAQKAHQVVLEQEGLVAQRALQAQVVKQVQAHLPQLVPQGAVLAGVAAQVCELQLKP